MAKRSIGQFIAALRRASGMTQQDIADRLHVSNKAVSRWERDECAPDISLIPDLAALLGVSCDELLRGERILETERTETAAGVEPRVSRQIKGLLHRTLSTFKTLSYIAIALALAGLACMLGVTLSFGRPYLGFFIMLLFEIATVTMAVLALSRAKDIRKDNEVWDMATEAQTQDFYRTLGNLSFGAFYAALAASVLSLRLLATASDPYWHHSYLTAFPFATLLLALVYLKGKPLYMAQMLGTPRAPAPHHWRLTLPQIAATAAASALFVLAPYGNAPFYDTDIPRIFDLPIAYVIPIALGFVLMAGSVIWFAVYTARNRESRREFLLTGIRNLALLPATVMAAQAHDVHWTGSGYHAGYTRYDVWFEEHLWDALAYCLAVALVFSLIDLLRQKRKAK